MHRVLSVRMAKQCIQIDAKGAGKKKKRLGDGVVLQALLQV